MELGPGGRAAVMSRRRVDLTERMLHLRALPAMARLPGSILKLVAAELRERVLMAGEPVLVVGERPSALAVVMDGHVDVSGRSRPIPAPLGLGLIPIAASAPAIHGVRAGVDLRVLELDAHVLHELMEEHDALLRSVVCRISSHLYGELHQLPVEVLESRLDGVDMVVPPRPLDIVERVLFLRSLRAFGQANLNAVAALARTLDEERHPAGTVLWREGESGDYSVFMGAGRVSCARADGKRWRAGASSVLGGTESLAERPRWYTLTAETPVVFFRSPLAGFMDLMADDNELARGFMSRLGAEVLGLLARRAVGVEDIE